MTQALYPDAQALIGARRRATPQRWSAGRKALLGTLVALTVVALAIAIALAWLHTERGRAFIARRIEAVAAENFLGRLHVASITRLSWQGVTARGVRFTAPNGDEVISVDEADFGVRWLPLLRGRIVSPHAAARGGRVLLRDDDRGRLSITEMFRSRGSASRGPARSANDATGSTVDLQRIDVSGVTFVSAVHAVPDSRVTGVQGRLAIRVRERDGSVLLTLGDLAGHGRLDTPIATTVRLTSGTLRIDTADTELLRADTRAVLDGQNVRIRCNAQINHERPRVAIRLALPAGAGPLAALPTIAQATAAAIASPSFDFDVARD